MMQLRRNLLLLVLSGFSLNAAASDILRMSISRVDDGYCNTADAKTNYPGENSQSLCKQNMDNAKLDRLGAIFKSYVGLADNNGSNTVVIDTGVIPKLLTSDKPLQVIYMQNSTQSTYAPVNYVLDKSDAENWQFLQTERYYPEVTLCYTDAYGSVRRGVVNGLSHPEVNIFDANEDIRKAFLQELGSKGVKITMDVSIKAGSTGYKAHVNFNRLKVAVDDSYKTVTLNKSPIEVDLVEDGKCRSF